MLRDQSGVYFGSEIKFVAALAGRRLKVTTTTFALSCERLQGSL